jgi:hypothetical protein
MIRAARVMSTGFMSIRWERSTMGIMHQEIDSDWRAAMRETDNLPAARRATTVTRSSAAFLLRMCLELHLSAMLMAVQLSAAEEDHAGPAPLKGPELPEPSGPGDALAANPCAESRRLQAWLEEDVELLCRLAADVPAARLDLAGVLGSTLRVDPESLVDNIAAHYRMIVVLLDERADFAPSENLAATADAARLRQRCVERLDILRRSAETPRTVSSLRSPRFLPGELLG